MARDLREPNPPVGIMTFDDVGLDDEDELTQSLRTIITNTVRETPGVSDKLLITISLCEVASYFKEFPAHDLMTRVTTVATNLAKNGKLVMVNWKAGGESSTEYYPSGASFLITPAGCLTPTPDGLKPTPAVLDPDEESLSKSLIQSLAWASENHPNALRKALAAYCPRCGASSQGHACDQ